MFAMKEIYCGYLSRWSKPGSDQNIDSQPGFALARIV